MERIITKSFARLMGRGTHRGFITYEELSKSLGKRNLSGENITQALMHILDDKVVLVKKKSDYKNLRKKEVFNQIDSTSILQEVIWTEGQNINAKFGVEWIKSLRVDLNWKRDYTSAASGYYTNSLEVLADSTFKDNLNDNFLLLNQRTQGNFKFTYISAPSSFTGNSLRNDSTVFENFLGQRLRASTLLASDQRPHGVDSIGNLGYTYGNGPNTQQVLIPAFIAAYSGREVVEDDQTQFLKLVKDITSKGFVRNDYKKKLVDLSDIRINLKGKK